MTGGCLLVAFAPDGATGDDDETIEKQDTKSLLFRCSAPFKLMSEVIFPTEKKRSFVLPNETHLLSFIGIMTETEKYFARIINGGRVLKRTGFLINKGGKFLKKLWCCVGGKYYKIIWFYQIGLCQFAAFPYIKDVRKAAILQGKPI